ncbi:GNAT family N-acetyltransferase [Ornithinimicrobium pratense]|uniref:GNAT family N-acetyltransferase n=1 Tax=Ornithinimicrobium pratense TaxID=2593973 RepID=A0A5J6V6T7_9MICO|nr:GNAT family N-acetyltransferase [Ornithinimicrobium pratense]QFG69498.1 GNAT family N-acetyltransferase [Ornithinimicrobium pratense]
MRQRPSGIENDEVHHDDDAAQRTHEFVARDAAEQAGVDIREMTTVHDLVAAPKLLGQVWGIGPHDPPPVSQHTLTALVHAGNYVVGAYRAADLVGVSIGFFGTPGLHLFHSHITGVLSGSTGRGLGLALKLHQRSWCLDRGVRLIEWTFDPLVVRNAGFNRNRLGARFVEYLPQFYGEMRDGRNSGQGSDRLLARWHLDEPVPQPDRNPPTGDTTPELLLLDVGDDEYPAIHGPQRVDSEGVLRLRVHPDIEDLRRRSPEAGIAWRGAVRDTLQPLMAEGWQVSAVARDGTYTLTRG